MQEIKKIENMENEKISISVRFENLKGEFYDIVSKDNAYYGRVDGDSFQVDFSAIIGEIIYIFIGDLTFIIQVNIGVYIFMAGDFRVVVIGDGD